MADVGAGSAPVVAGGGGDGVVAAAELDKVAASRDGGVVARARRGRGVGGSLGQLTRRTIRSGILASLCVSPFLGTEE